MQEYKIITLKNGLRLVLVPKTSTEVVTVLILLGVGSRQETDEVAGISHVLEHMHFKGTSIRPTGMKIAEFIESLGGEQNAFTGKEYTGYYAKLTPKHLEKAFDFLSDMLLHSKFDANELSKETDVIVEELNMYEELPMEVVENKFELIIFGTNSLGRGIIGTKETVKAVDRETLVAYRDKHYYAENAVLVLSGNFGEYSEEEIKKMADEYFALPSMKPKEQEKIVFPNKKSLNIQKRKTEQSHLIIGFRTVSPTHPDYFRLELLGTILGGGMSSRMFDEVREKRGLAYAVKTHVLTYQESGALFTQAGVPHEKIYEAIEAILSEYKKIKENRVDEAELNKAKEIIAGRILIKFEDSEELANHYAFETLLMDKVMTPKQIIETYRAISSDEILEVAKKYLVDDKMGLSFVGSDIDEEKLNKIFKI